MKQKSKYILSITSVGAALVAAQAANIINKKQQKIADARAMKWKTMSKAYTDTENTCLYFLEFLIADKECLDETKEYCIRQIREIGDCLLNMRADMYWFKGADSSVPDELDQNIEYGFYRSRDIILYKLMHCRYRIQERPLLYNAEDWEIACNQRIQTMNDMKTMASNLLDAENTRGSMELKKLGCTSQEVHNLLQDYKKAVGIQDGRGIATAVFRFYALKYRHYVSEFGVMKPEKTLFAQESTR